MRLLGTDAGRYCGHGRSTALGPLLDRPLRLRFCILAQFSRPLMEIAKRLLLAGFRRRRLRPSQSGEPAPG